jgi:hypothetical protein
MCKSTRVAGRVMAGFVYVLSNTSMPKLLKIGKTERDPTEFRVNELYTTGVPTPFKVEYFAYVNDHHRLERILHSRFESQRINLGREFFQISVEEAVIVLRQSTQVLKEKLFYKTEKEINEELKRKERHVKNEEDRLINNKKIKALEEEKIKIEKDKKENDKKKWDEAINFARNEVEKRKIKFIELHVDSSKNWNKTVFYGALLMSPTLIAGPILFFIFFIIFILPLAWYLSRNFKIEKADLVFNKDVIEKVANLHYSDKDWNEYLQQILSKYLETKKMKD